MNQNCQFVLKFGAYSHSRGIGGLTLVFVWGGALPGGSISVFQGFYASVGGVLVSGGGWALGCYSVGFRYFPKIVSLNSFRNSFGNSYIPCLKVIIAHRFTCGERKIW